MALDGGVEGGLVVFGTLSLAYLSHATGLVVAREEGVLRRWRATPLPSWGYFTGRMIATVLLADASGLILVGVAMFAWDPHRPRHARFTGTGTGPRSA